MLHLGDIPRRPSPFGDGLEHESWVHNPKATHRFFSQTPPKKVSIGSPAMKVKGWLYPALLVCLCHLRVPNQKHLGKQMHVSSMSHQVCADVLSISNSTCVLLLPSLCGDQPLHWSFPRGVACPMPCPPLSTAPWARILQRREQRSSLSMRMWRGLDIRQGKLCKGARSEPFRKSNARYP